MPKHTRLSLSNNSCSCGKTPSLLVECPSCGLYSCSAQFKTLSSACEYNSGSSHSSFLWPSISSVDGFGFKISSQTAVNDRLPDSNPALQYLSSWSHSDIQNIPPGNLVIVKRWNISIKVYSLLFSIMSSLG
jgi:hypothetical protein